MSSWLVPWVCRDGKSKSDVLCCWNEAQKSSLYKTFFDNFYVAELEELWKDLAACKEENGFISLPKKLERLFPLVKGKLMVRDCYSKLAHIVEERAEVQLLDSTQTGDSEMTDVTSPSAGTHVEKGYVGESFSSC